MSIQQLVTKQLMLEYQQRHDPAIFVKILKRTDKLLLHTILRLSRTKPHLQKVGMQELYHEAIIALGKAALSIKETEQDRYVPARIVAYITSEIRATYPYQDPKLLKRNVRKQVSEVSEDISALSDLIDLEQGLQCLSKSEKELIHERFYLDKTLKEIGKRMGLSYPAVGARIQKILTKLRKKLK